MYLLPTNTTTTTTPTTTSSTITATPTTAQVLLLLVCCGQCASVQFFQFFCIKKHKNTTIIRYEHVFGVLQPR